MHESQRRLHPGIPEVEVVLAHLVRKQHPLVDDRPRGHGRHVILLAVREPERLDRVARALADDVQLSLEGVGNHDALAAPDEDLADHRLDLPDGLPEIGAIDRDITPAEQHLPLVLDGALDFVLAGKAARGLARQKHHADTVLAERRKLHALLGHLLPEELVRKLHQDSGAVGCLGVGPDRAAMRQVTQDRQALADQRM